MKKTKKGSTTSRGNYYKQKTKKYFEKLGYTTQITEFMTTRPIGAGKVIYVKKDVFGCDGISMNSKEIIFWNSKHCTTNDKNNVDTQIRHAKNEYSKYPFPLNSESIKVLIIMWFPRVKTPTIIKYE